MSGSRPEPGDALILVDLQVDFCPGGALAVPDGDVVVPLANQLQAHFDFVVASQDWHPPDHGSFAANHSGCSPGDVIELNGLSQVLWPTHCVQESAGAAFHPELTTAGVHAIIRKGTDPGVDSYSAFQDNGGRNPTGLEGLLRGRGVEGVWIAGLATDYCVQYTALDAARAGFRTTVLAFASRAVELRQGDTAAALAAVTRAGARVETSSWL